MSDAASLSAVAELAEVHLETRRTAVASPAMPTRGLRSGTGRLLVRAPLSLSEVAADLPSASRDHLDPCFHSPQWSRRSIRLKPFAALSAGGLENAAADLSGRKVEAGDRLRTNMRAQGWAMLSDAELPIASFFRNGEVSQAGGNVRRIADQGDALLVALDEARRA